MLIRSSMGFDDFEYLDIKEYKKLKSEKNG